MLFGEADYNKKDARKTVSFYMLAQLEPVR
jgi:hypothetical protein